VRKTEASIRIHRPPAQIFDAFVNPQLLSGWWGVDRCLVEKRQGGVYSLAWDVNENGFRYVSTGLITVYLPPSELLVDHLVYFNPEKQILGPTFLHLRITDEGKISTLQLVQGNYQEGADWDWFYSAVAEAWPKALDSLRNFLEGNS